MNNKTNIVFLDTHPVETLNSKAEITSTISLEKSFENESGVKQTVKEVRISYRFIAD